MPQRLSNTGWDFAEIRGQSQADFEWLRVRLTFRDRSGGLVYIGWRRMCKRFQTGAKIIFAAVPAKLVVGIAGDFECHVAKRNQAGERSPAILEHGPTDAAEEMDEARHGRPRTRVAMGPITPYNSTWSEKSRTGTARRREPLVLSRDKIADDVHHQQDTPAVPWVHGATPLALMERRCFLILRR
jgi:hypothetical protein